MILKFYPVALAFFGILLSESVSAEENIVDKSMAAVAEYNQKIALEAGKRIQFPDFVFVYEGEIIPPANPAAPSGDHFRKRTFRIESSGETDQTISVTIGQTPPQPIKLKVRAKQFSLFLFAGPKKEKLYPDSFLIAGVQAKIKK